MVELTMTSLMTRWRKASTRPALSGLAGVTSLSLLSVSLLACNGILGDNLSPGANGDGDGDRTPAGVVGKDDIPTPQTRFRRLGHGEWQRTMADLLGVSSGPIHTAIQNAARNFRSDPVQGGFIFEGNGDSLEVDSTLWLSYQRAASEIAFAVVNDSSLFAALVPAGSSDDARGDAFIQSFGTRAHRRPLSSDQVAAYKSVFSAGKSAYPDHSGLQGGVRLLLETFLQSPHFLYRVESSDRVLRGVIPLDGYERASRLSYFFWGTMPDAALFAAAAAGELDGPAGVKAQAARLVADPRARDTIVHFFEKVLEVERYENISPSSSAFPDISPSFAQSARGETSNFVGGVMYDDSGSLRDFLTSTTTYVDDELAAIYGLEGAYDDTFQEVTLDGSQRAGVFTQIGFLAKNATSVDPDPIHRGVFLVKRITCQKIAAPPDAVPPLPTPMGQSNRQLVEEHTEAEGTTCRNCHTTLINPYGFAFEHYDAIGAFRTEDRSHPVNSATEVYLDGGQIPVANAVELASTLADSEQVHNCLSGHLIAFAQGRDSSTEDTALKKLLGTASLQEAVSFRDLMVEVAVAISFLNRAAEAE
jgi:hypothetical protein